MASGMGGMRTTGDLVARMQMSRGMKIAEAKKYVADRLGVAVSDLTDDIAMREVREDNHLGIVRSIGASPKGIEAKHHIAEVLGISINCLERYKARIGIGS